jgi:hypothetical protein
MIFHPVSMSGAHGCLEPTDIVPDLPDFGVEFGSTQNQPAACAFQPIKEITACWGALLKITENFVAIVDVDDRAHF